MMVDLLLIGEITVYEQDPGTSTMPDISGSEVRPDILDIVGMFFLGQCSFSYGFGRFLGQ